MQSETLRMGCPGQCTWTYSTWSEWTSTCGTGIRSRQSTGCNGRCYDLCLEPKQLWESRNRTDCLNNNNNNNNNGNTNSTSGIINIASGDTASFTSSNNGGGGFSVATIVLIVVGVVAVIAALLAILALVVFRRRANEAATASETATTANEGSVKGGPHTYDDMNFGSDFGR